MGSRSISALAAVILVAATTIGWSSSTVQRRSAIDGTWEYQGVRRGWATFENGHYVFFSVPTDSLPGPGGLSDSLRAALYRRMNAEAGTYAVTDTLVTMQRRHTKDPRTTPSTWRWSYVLKGDTIIFRSLNAEGKGTGVDQRSVRVK